LFALDLIGNSGLFYTEIAMALPETSL